MSLETISGGLATLSAVVASIVFFYASKIEVPDNLDTIVGELQRISRWNSYGCMAAAFSAICAAVVFAKQSKFF